MELLTYEIVFQSVLLRGGKSGYSRKTLESIMKLTRSGKYIYSVAHAYTALVLREALRIYWMQ
jgi:hypothetical protein